MKPFREKDSTVNSMKTHIKSLRGISWEIHYCQESSKDRPIKCTRVVNSISGPKVSVKWVTDIICHPLDIVQYFMFNQGVCISKQQRSWSCELLKTKTTTTPTQPLSAEERSIGFLITKWESFIRNEI